MTVMPTRGPYSYSADKDTQGRAGFRIDAPDVSLIGWIPIGYGDPVEVETNAKLFACSFELLHMVKRLVGANFQATMTERERAALIADAHALIGKVHN